MEEELKFRTAVKGYRREDVLEYVENMQEELFRRKKQSEEMEKGYQERITELERLLKQEQFHQKELEDEEETAKRKEENLALKETLAELEKSANDMRDKLRKVEAEKQRLAEKLAREIIRQRKEICKLEEKVREAEARAAENANWEAIQKVVSEVQFHISEYVNTMNKTQQRLACAYQKTNSIKEQISKQQEKSGAGAAVTGEES